LHNPDTLIIHSAAPLFP